MPNASEPSYFVWRWKRETSPFPFPQNLIQAMAIIQWDVKPFRELSAYTFFELLQLRVDVFVVEQQCAYRELDEYDRHSEARHLSGRNEVGELLAYARLLPPGLRYSEVNLGRFVVRADSRKKGIGHQLLQTALQEISRGWPQAPIRISAQDYLQKFYERYGFIKVTEVYLEDGIPHVEMVKEV
jgi:ElaA protein